MGFDRLLTKLSDFFMIETRYNEDRSYIIKSKDGLFSYEFQGMHKLKVFNLTGLDIQSTTDQVTTLVVSDGLICHYLEIYWLYLSLEDYCRLNCRAMISGKPNLQRLVLQNKKLQVRELKAIMNTYVNDTYDIDSKKLTLKDKIINLSQFLDLNLSDEQFLNIFVYPFYQAFNSDHELMKIGSADILKIEADFMKRIPSFQSKELNYDHALGLFAIWIFANCSKENYDKLFRILVKVARINFSHFRMPVIQKIMKEGTIDDMVTVSDEAPGLIKQHWSDFNPLDKTDYWVHILENTKNKDIHTAFSRAARL